MAGMPWMGREGMVVLSLTIDAKGILQDVEVIESAGNGFDAAFRQS
jgi:TonB family protein